MRLNPKFPLFVLFLFIVSCASKKDILYLQGANGEIKNEKNIQYEPTIQADDVLLIVVSAENPEVAIPYNSQYISFSANTPGVLSQSQQLQTYLVDKEGNVFFPMFGKIKLAGQTRVEAIKTIGNLLSNDIKNALVNVRILNFKISVLGEVNRPGVQQVNSERITLLEAISAAGDLTIYGKRNEITVIREKDGIKSVNKVDITHKEFINSPFYYLSQNDVVYVEPNKTKINSSAVGPNAQVILYAISIISTILLLTLKK